jgi:hypothetical protein
VDDLKHLKIWKQTLEFEMKNGVYVAQVKHSDDGYLLSVGNQNEVPTAWFVTDPRKPQDLATWVSSVGTGGSLPVASDNPSIGAIFLNTLQFNDGRVVLHIFLDDVRPVEDEKDNVNERLETLSN